jgi:branched-chain amino acid transport system permease protein
MRTGIAGGVGRAGWVLALMLALALIVPLLGQPYYTRLVARMAIYGVAALSLDLLVGYGGLVSFGHAAFFGIGVYAAGLLPFAGIDSVLVVVPVAMGSAALYGVLTGAISLRATGLYFIFITLAFAEMLFFVAQGLRMFGGDDGFRLPAPTRLPGGASLADPVVLAWSMIAVLAIAIWVGRRLTDSHFGQVVVAARDNEVKLRAMGLSPYPYRLTLYALAAAMAAVAGVGFGNLVEYASPASMSWVVSGELLFMVILGSAGTITGPVLGAIVFTGLEQLLSGWTEHWMFWLGLLLVLRVLLLRQGLHGLLVPGRGR